ncbi:50S ribosomal protein L11 methyltransferase [uncultured Veillonella sp.]|uniref:50S ribosomal protein L11 methyltransferase n=1 Tax=uncultured Veillonella sp. TaxID=159268 RepID=UPI002600903E|nr:50S ribosomal protein L11 methyltransferase [uncultured Veillonella sp.]MDY3974734.1 50S ribosomal protein L11 methyltransferase [Veillonella caviae]
MEWIEISIAIQRVVIDEVTTLFDTFSSNGFIEEDIEHEPEWTKLTIYGDMSQELSWWEQQVKSLLDGAHIAYKDLHASIVTDADWYNSWQQYIEPTEILPHIIIKPAWKDYEAKAGDRIIEIDSDLSFGTGAHETTRSCAALMAKYGKDKEICLDIGTGTAILLLVAHELGIQQLVGIDIEASAIEQSKANCEANQVRAELICGNLDEDYKGAADLIVANLTVDPLKILLPTIGLKLSKHGILIISGIIDDRYDEIMPYITKDWHIKEELVNGSWHTFALEPITTP